MSKPSTSLTLRVSALSLSNIPRTPTLDSPRATCKTTGRPIHVAKALSMHPLQSSLPGAGEHWPKARSTDTGKNDSWRAPQSRLQTIARACVASAIFTLDLYMGRQHEEAFFREFALLLFAGCLS